jgi:hypothetical protein
VTPLELFAEPAPPAVEPRRLPLLSTTAAGKYRRCPRLYYFEQRLRVRPLYTPAALRFGSTMHLGLEAWLRSGLDLQAAWSAIDAAESDPFEAARARALMSGYHTRWKDAPVKVLHVEARFDAPLVNPATGAPSTSRGFTGRLDAVVEWEGRPWIVEHKTTGQDIDDAAYWSAVRLSAQVGDYLAGARALGIEPAGVIYDVLHTPGHRPLKQNQKNARDETPEEFFARICKDIAKKPGGYYARRTEVRLADELREAAADLWAAHKDIQRAERSGVWPRNTGACRVGRSLCAFVPVCRGERTVDDRALYSRKEG